MSRELPSPYLTSKAACFSWLDWVERGHVPQLGRPPKGRFGSSFKLGGSDFGQFAPA